MAVAQLAVVGDPAGVLRVAGILIIDVCADLIAAVRRHQSLVLLQYLRCDPGGQLVSLEGIHIVFRGTVRRVRVNRCRWRNQSSLLLLCSSQSSA